MKELVAAGALFASTIALASPALAHTSPGSPSGYVNDFAQVLSDQTKRGLESELAAFEQTTSNQVAVAIVPSMGGDYIENYAIKLFEEWEVGKKDTDNGVLLLLSIEERKMRIEVGYGLEGALPDSVAQSILNNEMTPRLKAGDYDGAVTAGVRAIEAATRGEYTATQKPAIDFRWHVTSLNALLENLGFFAIILPLFLLQFFGAILARSRSWWAGGAIGLIGGLGIGWLFALALLMTLPLAILLTLLGLGFDYLVSRSYQSAKARGVNPPWFIGGGGRGGHSSGGGFGGFGGGSSGGGGASGSW